MLNIFCRDSSFGTPSVEGVGDPKVVEIEDFPCRGKTHCALNATHTIDAPSFTRLGKTQL